MANISPPLAYAQYLGTRLAAGMLLAADIETSLALAKGVAGTLYPLFKSHANRTREHLRFAFPHFSEVQIEQATRQAFEHLSMIGVEMLHTPRTLHPASFSEHVDVSQLSKDALALLNARKPVVLVTGHVGSWELLGYGLAVMGYPMHAIARPLDNPLINQWIFGIRQKRGMRILDKSKAALKSRTLLGAGEMVGFIADQNAGPTGCFVPFLGRLASAHKTAAVMAIKSNIPVMCGAAIRQSSDGSGKLFRYSIADTDIIRPEEWANLASQDDKVFFITSRWARAVEKSVEANPGQYLWMHRRWRSRPKFEEEGQPMPVELEKRLEALPWMTQEKLGRMKDYQAAK